MTPTRRPRARAWHSFREQDREWEGGTELSLESVFSVSPRKVSQGGLHSLGGVALPLWPPPHLRSRALSPRPAGTGTRVCTPLLALPQARRHH